MSILCKIFGHKHGDIGAKQSKHLVRTGWECEYNQAYHWVEIGFNCNRCNKLIPVGVVSEENEKKVST